MRKLYKSFGRYLFNANTGGDGAGAGGGYAGSGATDGQQGSGAGTGAGAAGGGEGASGGGAGETAGAGAATDWRTSLPADLREAPGLKDVKDIGGLAKQFLDQQRFLGTAIRPPGEDASDASRLEVMQKIQKHFPNLIVKPDTTDEKAMNDFWAMAGVPTDEAGYEVPAEVQVDQEWLAATKANARKYGLTKGNFQKFVADQVAQKAAQETATNEFLTGEMKKLSTEWGGATESKIADIQKFCEAMEAPEDFKKAIGEKQASVGWYKFLDKIIQQFGGLGEGKTVAFQPNGNSPDTPAELNAQINEIMKNPAYQNGRDPDHNRLVKKVIELRQKLTAN